MDPIKRQTFWKNAENKPFNKWLSLNGLMLLYQPFIFFGVYIMQFPYPLCLMLMVDDKGMPLFNRRGLQLWKLTEEFIFISGNYRMRITVPKGFVTDLASIPKIPFLYEYLGNIIQMPAVIHDYLYSTAEVSRIVADGILLEAMQVTNVDKAQQGLIYNGVRVGGESAYNAN